MKKSNLLTFTLGLIVPVLLLGQSKKDLTVVWGDTDIRYEQDYYPAKNLKAKSFTTPAWRGEKVNAQAVIIPGKDLSNVKVSLSDLKSSMNVIPASAAKCSFVEYVIADTLLAQYGQCGARKKSPKDSILVADIIDNALSKSLSASQAQPVWISINVPVQTAAGKYKGSLTVSSDDAKSVSIPVELTVVNRVMPSPEDWKFHLNLWQNPFAVARYHNVPLWSKAHFDYLRPVMKMLANAGQKVITASILDKPWNGQTEDPFKSMVTKIKRADGTWTYDYTVFDMWVEFMMSVGIKDYIDCYSLIPWKLTFDYLDQATGEMTCINGDPTSKEYKLYWGHFIKDFAKHLKEKGWFEITTLAMDERPQEAMEAAMSLIKSVEPDFKVSLAGSLHKAIEQDIFNLCVSSTEEFPYDIRERRAEEGKISTYYTCCAEKYPNTFTMSPAYEASWIGCFAFAKHFDGYLRWAYNSWTIDPLKDSRFRSWTSGDCYIVYPEERSSIRFEKLIEGIRDYEKATIMRDKWTAEGNVTKLAKLESVLSRFEIKNIPAGDGQAAIAEARKLINQ